MSVRTNCAVGTSTLPPRWPHFFSDESWSSKWTPAAPASMNAFISSKALSGPPKPASASATIGASQSIAVLALGRVDLIGAQQRVVDAASRAPARCSPGRGSGPGTCGRRGSRRPPPASRRDRSPSGQPSPSGRPGSGQRAERGDIVLGVQQAATDARRRDAPACARCGSEPRMRSTSSCTYGRSTPDQRPFVSPAPISDLPTRLCPDCSRIGS